MIIRVSVKPNSREKSIEMTGENEYLVRLEASPVKGKANLELIKLLSRYLRVSTGRIIIKTPSSRRKIIEILDK